MQVVTENTPFPAGLVAINNFGFGGTNVHLILRGRAEASHKDLETVSGKCDILLLMMDS